MRLLALRGSQVVAELLRFAVLWLETECAGHRLLGLGEFRFHAERGGEADPGLRECGSGGNGQAEMRFCAAAVIAATRFKIAELILRQGDGGIDENDLFQDRLLVVEVIGFVEGGGDL